MSFNPEKRSLLGARTCPLTSNLVNKSESFCGCAVLSFNETRRSGHVLSILCWFSGTLSLLLSPAREIRPKTKAHPSQTAVTVFCVSRLFSHTLRHRMRKSSGPSPIKQTSKVQYRNSQRMSRLSMWHLIPVVFGESHFVCSPSLLWDPPSPRSHAYNRNFTASLLTKGMRAMLGNCPKLFIFIAIEKWVLYRQLFQFFP